jgi:alpha-glucoside transport system permease protein
MQDVGASVSLVLLGLGAFLATVAIGYLLASRASTGVQSWLKYVIFFGPAGLLLLVGLVYPALRTIWLSFLDARGEEFVGLGNYIFIFSRPELLLVVRNTLLWVVIVPILSTAVGLLIAYLTDRMRGAAIVKSLIFMPMAISFVGASIIWKFVYNFEPNENRADIGLLSAVVKGFGGDPPNWLLEAPLNTFLLMVVMIWIQSGFAMVILSAAMKAVPDEIVEASMLDGANQVKRFFQITVPMIRNSIVVVLSTITIATLKVFDIVRTMTGGNFETSVVANEMYTQAFRSANTGTGSGLAVVLFLMVIPLVVYNIRQIRLERTER